MLLLLCFFILHVRFPPLLVKPIVVGGVGAVGGGTELPGYIALGT